MNVRNQLSKINVINCGEKFIINNSGNSPEPSNNSSKRELDKLNNNLQILSNSIGIKNQARNETAADASESVYMNICLYNLINECQQQFPSA